MKATLLCLSIAVSALPPGVLAEEAGVPTMDEVTNEMEHPTFYSTSMIAMVVLVVALGYFARPSTTEAMPDGFRKFMLSYLLVWGLASSGDWMQGIYYYEHLEEGYGFEHDWIATSFSIGFASAGICGCFVGTLVDKYGRKLSCMMYCIIYTLSCFCLHMNNWGAICFGRVLGGIATSLLFSSFECWMVSAHFGRGFSPTLLSYMFGLMFTLLYITGIIAGLLGGLLESLTSLSSMHEASVFHFGGALLTFDAAIFYFGIAIVAIATLFDENYGQKSGASGEGPVGLFQLPRLVGGGVRMVVLVLVGLVVATFEGSMFVFVFLWWPAVKRFDLRPTPGDLFSMFMMACMCGACSSTLAGRFLSASQRVTLSIVLSVACFGVAAVAVVAEKDDPFAPKLLFVSLMLFEFATGMYFPSIGVVKSDCVPDSVRATIYNLYRLPLNIIVIVLLNCSLSIHASFWILACLMIAGLLCSCTVIFLEATPAVREARLRAGAAAGGAATELVLAA